MYEGSLGIHQVEFMVKSGEDFGNGGGVGNHADSSHDFSEITSWDNSWWLIVNSDFESSWAPVIEFNGSLGLDGSNSGVNILGTTSPLYIMEQAIYLLCLGSHLAIMLAGSNEELMISATESCS